MSDLNAWDQLLARVSERVGGDENPRSLASCSYASDSGDQIVVWVPSEPNRRHLEMHYLDMLEHELRALGRPGTRLRFVVSGYGDEDDGE